MVTESFRELKELVEHSASVQASAVVLLRDLADRLNEIAKHPTATDIRMLAADIKQHAQELASAVALHAEDKAEEKEEEKEEEKAEEKEEEHETDEEEDEEHEPRRR